MVTANWVQFIPFFWTQRVNLSMAYFHFLATYICGCLHLLKSQCSFSVGKWVGRWTLRLANLIMIGQRTVFLGENTVSPLIENCCYTVSHVMLRLNWESDSALQRSLQFVQGQVHSVINELKLQNLCANSNVVEILAFGWILFFLKFWNVVEILKFVWNSEIWWNFSTW